MESRLYDDLKMVDGRLRCNDSVHYKICSSIDLFNDSVHQ